MKMKEIILYAKNHQCDQIRIKVNSVNVEIQARVDHTGNCWTITRKELLELLK